MNANENDFKITWRIVNFSMCKLDEGQSIESPIFVVDSLGNTNWFLRLFPRGICNEEYIKCFLVRAEEGPEEIRIKYSISIEYSKLSEVRTFRRNEQAVLPASVRRDKVLSEIQKLPVIDILIVECLMCSHSNDCESQYFVSDVNDLEPKSACNVIDSNDEFTNDMDDIEAVLRKIRPYPESCSAYTLIPVEKWCFMWSIKNFSTLLPNYKLRMPMISVSPNSPKILLFFYLTNEDFLQLDIRVLDKTHRRTFILKCKIQLVDIDNDHRDVVQDMHKFGSESWCLSLNVHRNRLINDQDLYLPDDVLRLRCEFAISYGNATSQIDSCGYKNSTLPVPHNRRNDMHLCLCGDSIHYDSSRCFNIIYDFTLILILVLTIMFHFFLED